MEGFAAHSRGQFHPGYPQLRLPKGASPWLPRMPAVDNPNCPPTVDRTQCGHRAPYRTTAGAGVRPPRLNVEGAGALLLVADIRDLGLNPSKLKGGVRAFLWGFPITQFAFIIVITPTPWGQIVPASCRFSAEGRWFYL